MLIDRTIHTPFPTCSHTYQLLTLGRFIFFKFSIHSLRAQHKVSGSRPSPSRPVSPEISQERKSSSGLRQTSIINHSPLTSIPCHFIAFVALKLLAKGAFLPSHIHLYYGFALHTLTVAFITLSANLSSSIFPCVRKHLIICYLLYLPVLSPPPF